MLTVAPETKLLPITTIDVPPEEFPEAGETEFTIGGGAFTAPPMFPVVDADEEEDCT